MHEELVDRKRWISNDRFLHALNYCMLLPGPEAQQLAIYIGWLLNGTWGGIAAGVLFVLPAFVLVLLLSWAYVVHGDISWVAALFYGLRVAVVALVFAALLRVGARALKNPLLGAIAGAAFVALYFYEVPFPVVIALAAAVGLAGRRVLPGLLTRADDEVADAVIDDGTAVAEKRSWWGSLKVLAIGLAIWWGPLAMVLALRGSQDTLGKEAVFFSQAAMVTFGGAYAVLAYINQAAVEQFGWLSPGQMVTGLGLAESTPGPLILVTEFVGFLGAYRFPGGLDPVLAGVLGAAVATWATFAPCFLWIFLGAPYIERLRGRGALDAALAAVTAAVVGVIGSLAATFATQVLFTQSRAVRVAAAEFAVPVVASADPFALAFAAIAFVGLWRYRWNVLWLIGGSALAGLVYRSL